MNVIKDRVAFYVRFPVLILITLIDSIKVIFMMLLWNDKNRFHKAANNWAKNILRIAGIKVIIEGIKPKDNGQSYIFISNHSSLWDIPILLHGTNCKASIVYKKELEKVPIFGWSLKKSPFIAVDRGNPRNAMNSIEEATKSIKAGTSIIVFPEGTRTIDTKMIPFKRGAFLIASKSGNPIIPLTIVGSGELSNGGLFFKPKPVKLIFHPIIENEKNWNKVKEKEMLENIYNIISRPLEKS